MLVSICSSNKHNTSGQTMIELPRTYKSICSMASCVAAWLVCTCTQRLFKELHNCKVTKHYVSLSLLGIAAKDEEVQILSGPWVGCSCRSIFLFG